MSVTLREELKQQKPFRSLEEEVSLNLYRTVALLEEINAALFVSYGITAAQYNVLRILRGAGSTGLGRNEIRDRMVSRMPDVSRLLERMEQAGWINRERSTTDRRCIPTTLTTKGLELLEHIRDPLADLQHQQFAHISLGQLHFLVETLTQIRNPPEQP
jgi:DNA-binding MarR family transcriptional regulator